MVAEPSTLEKEFVAPPAAARPWVYWFWLNSNITREGITADLEAMQRVGIGGVLIMEVDQGAPQGPVSFAGPKWRELFKHMLSEANRLGLEVNMSNDAGWCGSGGPWITPELSMQYLVWTETSVEGGKHFDAALPEPQADGELLSRHHRAGLPHAGRQCPDREYQRQDGPRSPGSAAGPGQVCGSAGRPGHQGRFHRRSLRPVSRTAA